jgi:hypothetical protein
LLAHGQKCTREKPKGRVDRGQLRRIDLHWHDLRHHAESRIMPIAGEARRGILGDLGISSGHRAA